MEKWWSNIEFLFVNVVSWSELVDSSVATLAVGGGGAGGGCRCHRCGLSRWVAMAPLRRWGDEELSVKSNSKEGEFWAEGHAKEGMKKRRRIIEKEKEDQKKTKKNKGGSGKEVHMHGKGR